MSRMDLQQDEALRSSGWRVFRSSTRDRVIPSSSAGAALQRVRIASALPVAGVTEGVTLSFEERAALSAARDQVLQKALPTATPRSLGVTQYLNVRLREDVGFGVAGEVTEVERVIGLAPFDGFITELVVMATPSSTLQAYAFRTSGGQTMFRTIDNQPSSPFDENSEPDFMLGLGHIDGSGKYQVQNVKMPVYAGEQIIAAIRHQGVAAIGTDLIVGSIGFEGFVLARQGSAAAVSQFGALTVEARRAATEAASNTSKLAVERERTRRAEAEARARVEVAKLNAESKRSAAQPAFNPFQGLLVAPQAQQALQSRQRVVPPPPPAFAAPSAPAGGEGQTFVQSWMPQSGSIGYLIPDPPRGGRVNVFDNKYTIWDISGQKVGEGAITPVRSDAEIPESARISKNLGVRTSSAIREDQAGILASRAGQSAF